MSQKNYINTEGTCHLCGCRLPLTELKFLPETELWVRQNALNQMGKAGAPDPLDTEAVAAKYGMPWDALLCEECLKKLVRKA